MKFRKTAKTFGNIDVIVPFSSEEVETTSIRVVKSTATSIIVSEFKPEDIIEKDIFGNVLSCTTYSYTKEITLR